MDTKKEIPLPIVLGIAVLALLLVVGGGFWFLNRPNGTSNEEARKNLEEGMKGQQQGPRGGGSSSNMSSRPMPPGVMRQ